MYRLIYAILLLLIVMHAHAAGDMTAQKPVEVSVELGDKKNRLKFYPNNFRFETGKLYKLIIKNPSQQKHYFTSTGLARSVFTRKVEIIKQNKTIAEVKGNINEIEVYPGGTTEWWFVPVKTLKSTQLHCSIKGHSEAGMTGHISIY